MTSCFDNTAFNDFMNEPTDILTIKLENATLVEVIDSYTKYKSIIRPNFDNQWFTTRKYIVMLENICGTKILPQKVSEMFYPYLIRIMLQNGCATTTIERTCSQIRACLEWGSRYGAPISPSYDRVDFNGQTRESTVLTYNELCHLYYFDLNTLPRHRRDWHQRMERTRDMFIFSVLFGQRHSDTVRIDKTCFDDDGNFNITQLKTGNRVSFSWKDYVFDSKIAKELLDKYNFKCPYSVSVSVYDRSLHELFKNIGMEFLDNVKTEEKILGEIQVKTFPRWKLIGSHTSRRTAITYWANKGMSIHKLRKFSGHKDIRALQRYILDDDSSIVFNFNVNYNHR